MVFKQTALGISFQSCPNWAGWSDAVMIGLTGSPRRRFYWNTKTWAQSFADGQVQAPHEVTFISHIYFQFVNHIWVCLNTPVATKLLWWRLGEHVVLRHWMDILCSVHSCTVRSNLEMEPKYLTKSDVQLKPNISKTKKIKGYCKKHYNHECLVIVMMYHVSNKFLKKKKEFTSEVWVFSLFRDF